MAGQENNGISYGQTVLEHASYLPVPLAHLTTARTHDKIPPAIATREKLKANLTPDVRPMLLLSCQSIQNGPEAQGEEIGYMYGQVKAMVECTPPRASFTSRHPKTSAPR